MPKMASATTLAKKDLHNENHVEPSHIKDCNKENQDIHDLN